MKHYPNLQVVYNMQPWQKGDDQLYEHYQSVKKLPARSAFNREREAIVASVRQCVEQILLERAMPRLDEGLRSVFDEHSIGEYPTDRTLCFFIGDPAAFVPALFARLQQLLREKFPLWRLAAQYEGIQSLIYPDAVVFGGQPVEGTFIAEDSTYKCWLQSLFVYREAKFGPIARQLQWANHIIRIRLAELSANDFLFIGAFYDTLPEWNDGCVWIAQRGSRDPLNLDLDEAGIWRNSAVSERGEIQPEYDRRFYPYSDVVPPYLVLTFAVPRKTPQVLNFTDPNNNQIHSVRLEAFVSDHNLREMLAGV